MHKAWTKSAFPSIGATEAHELYNTLMSAIRVSVEWNYKDLKQLWSFTDFPRALKVRQATHCVHLQGRSSTSKLQDLQGRMGTR